MEWNAVLTVAIVGGVIGLLALTRISSDVVMIAGATALMLCTGESLAASRPKARDRAPQRSS